MKQLLTIVCGLLLGASPAMTLESNARARRGADAGPSQSLGREKRERTPAQRKIDSQLLFAIYRQRGEAEAKGVPAGELGVKFDEQGRAYVSIRARVTRSLLARIKAWGGRVISSSARYDDVRAAVPLDSLEKIAALKDVRAVMPAEEATTNGATTNR